MACVRPPARAARAQKGALLNGAKPTGHDDALDTDLFLSALNTRSNNNPNGKHMTRNLNLRLQEADLRALDAAAAAIAGPEGAAYVRPMTILRRALEVFNAQSGQTKQEARQ